MFNPYQRTLSLMGKALDGLLEPNCVHAYGFGDAATRDESVFNLAGADEDEPCLDLGEVLLHYNRAARAVSLGGPTSFAPLIDRAVRHVARAGNAFHLLVIVADGQVGRHGPTLAALAAASRFPLSVVLVGVGDGPWGAMEDCDDRLGGGRAFDNFQFVDLHSTCPPSSPPAEAARAFALAALMEVPAQYSAMRRLGYFDRARSDSV